jgi:hypothetical protein
MEKKNIMDKIYCRATVSFAFWLQNYCAFSSCQEFGNFITAILFNPEYNSAGVKKKIVSHWVPLFALIPVIPLIF